MPLDPQLGNHRGRKPTPYPLCRPRIGSITGNGPTPPIMPSCLSDNEYGMLPDGLSGKHYPTTSAAHIARPYRTPISHAHIARPYRTPISHAHIARPYDISHAHI